MNNAMNPDFWTSLPGDADVYEVAQAFSEAQDARPGDHTLLREWTARYPQYADDLIAVGYARFALGRSLTDEVEDEDEIAREPLADLIAEANARGLGVTEFAAALRLDKRLLGKVSRRLLDAATLPRTLIAQIAQTQDRTVEEVAIYLRGGPQMAPVAHYRAKSAPMMVAEVAARQSFTDALRSDTALSDEDYAYWQAEMAKGTLGDE